MEIGNAIAGLLVAALPSGEAPWWVGAGLALVALLLYSPVVRDWAQPSRRRRDQAADEDAVRSTPPDQRG